jgi:hypothetical protein
VLSHGLKRLGGMPGYSARASAAPPLRS